MGNYHARFGVGENPEITSKDYLSLFILVGSVKMSDHVVREMMGL